MPGQNREWGREWCSEGSDGPRRQRDLRTGTSVDDPARSDVTVTVGESHVTVVLHDTGALLDSDSSFLWFGTVRDGFRYFLLAVINTTPLIKHALKRCTPKPNHALLSPILARASHHARWITSLAQRWSRCIWNRTPPLKISSEGFRWWVILSAW